MEEGTWGIVEILESIARFLLEENLIQRDEELFFLQLLSERDPS